MKRRVQRHPTGALKRARLRGFGLLEVLVALAVFAIAGTTVFDWLNQSLRTATRLSRVDEESRLLLTAQALASAINPVDRPQGELTQSGLRLRWRSETVLPLRTSAVGPEGVPRSVWLTGLARLSVDAQDQRTGAEVHFDLLQPTLKLRPSIAAARAAEDAR